jgi:hypothetical protein
VTWQGVELLQERVDGGSVCHRETEIGKIALEADELE